MFKINTIKANKQTPGEKTIAQTQEKKQAMSMEKRRKTKKSLEKQKTHTSLSRQPYKRNTKHVTFHIMINVPKSVIIAMQYS